MAYALPYTLSSEDETLFSSLASSALIHQLSMPGSGEFADRVREDRRAKERKLLEPYADLLETEIRRHLVALKPADVLAELRACPLDNMQVKLFSWNTVFFNESLHEMLARVDTMTFDERARHREAIMARDHEMEQAGACHTFGVMTNDSIYGYDDDGHDDYIVLKPVKIHRIFTKTNLAQRLVMLFGPNFAPTFRYESVPELERPGADGYVVSKVTLCARYYPDGLPKSKLLELLKTARAENTRRDECRTRVLSPFEWLVGIGDWRKGSRKTMVTPPHPRPLSLLGTAPCYCGHHNEEDSE